MAFNQFWSCARTKKQSMALTEHTKHLANERMNEMEYGKRIQKLLEDANVYI